MTALTIERLSKRYGALHVLRNISLSIAEGELVSLLGPSGCGKTTTLRCIAGFTHPDSGRVLFGNRDVTATLPEQRDIGMVFQSYALFPHMTVAENLGFGLEARRIPAPERRRRCAEALSMVRLDGYESRFPRELSGGQQQRVALARALVIEPSLLLLDEPLANLDAGLRDEMRYFIRDVQQRVGITSIYVTHDQAEAMVMSDRIVVMRDGEVVQFGSPREIYERPASLPVARFIGRSSTIKGVVALAEGGLYAVDTPHGRLAAAGPPGLAAGAAILLMLRPESIRTTGRLASDNVLGGTVRKVVYQGNACQVAVRLDAGDEIITDISGKSAVAAGDRLSLAFAPSDAWLLAG